MKVVCLAVTPPEKFFKWSNTNWKKYSKFTLITGSGSKSVVGEKYLAFLSYTDFTRYARRIDSNAIVVVFCPYHQILQYSHVVNFLDGKPDGIKYKAKKRLYVPKTLIDFSFDRMENYVTILSDLIEQGSMLTHFMTYIYTLDSKTQQKPVNFIVSNWMRTQDSPDVLHDSLMSLENPVSEKQFTNIMAILEMPVTKRVRIVMQEVTDDDLKDIDNSPNIISLSDSFDVDPYEVRYLLKKSLYDANKIIDDDIKVV